MGAQIFVNGLIDGVAVAVLGLAFQLVYLPTRVFHVALGGLYTLAPFIAWDLLQRSVPLPMSIPLAVAATAAVSVLAELSNHGVLAKRQATFSAQFISSLGLYIVLVQAVSLIWGNTPRALRSTQETVLHIAGIALTASEAMVVGTAVAILIAFFLWLNFTRVGLQFRALADNPRELSLRGYDLRSLRIIAFGLSGAMVAAVSITSAWNVGFWSYSGISVLLLAIVAAIIGGRHSFFGPVLGGLLLESIRAQVSWYMSARWLDAATFIVLAAFLLFRPNGIIRRRARLEAEAVA
jgi:branched-chain amino acid transport system permease protein